MSVRTVAWKDLTGVRRSRALWGGVTILALVMAVVAYAFEGYQLSPRAVVLNLLRTLTLGFGVVGPIVALVVSYLAVAGERRTGGIKFLLSVPNTRRDVFFGKLASRLLLVGGGLAFVFVTTMSVSVAAHGTLPLVPALGLFALSLVYLAVFVAVAVALSAAVGTRGRAVAASIAAYFLLVLFFVIPGLQLPSLVSFAHQSVLGFDPNPNLYDAVSYVSPYTAFQKSVNLVFLPDYQTTVFYRASDAPGRPWYLGDATSLVVFAGWLAVSIVVGYRTFDRTDLE